MQAPLDKATQHTAQNTAQSTVQNALPHQQRKNQRTGLVLLSVAAVFFAGIVLRKWLEPVLLRMLGG